MKTEEKQKIFREKAEELGYEVIEYSGRFMFGETCPAVVVGNPADFIAEIGLKGLKWDNMGKFDYVVYTG